MTQLANSFVCKNIDVTLVNFDKDSSFYYINPKVNVIKMNLDFNTNSKLLKILKVPIIEIKRFCRIRKIIKNINPDIVLPFLEMAEVLTIPNCIMLKKPFCVSLRNDFDKYFKYMKILAKLTYSKAKLVVCQTKAVVNQLNKHVKCNTTVIPNPLDKSSFIEAIPKERRKVIINVGRLTAQKNQELLIKSFSKIAKDFPEYDLHIFGKGELKERLENLIVSLGLQQRVFLKGVIPNAVTKNNDASLFIMSSNYEGFPNTLVEAMANGIPAISTDFDTKAAKEILNDGEYGYLVPVGDENALANSIKDVLENYDIALEKAKKALYIREELDAENIVDCWIEKIENVL